MSTPAWGPQAQAVAVRPDAAPGRWLRRLGLAFVVLVAAWILSGIGQPKAVPDCTGPSCYVFAEDGTAPYQDVQRQQQAQTGDRVGDFVTWIVVLAVAGAAAKWVVRRRRTAAGGLRRALASTPKTPAQQAASAPDALAATQVMAAEAFGSPGGHVGWQQGTGTYITARPRGGMLVIGPPSSGKSSGVIIPSVIIAPGACVASSIKGDVMAATALTRSRLGRVWHFDPGGEEQAAPGVAQCRWSPLVSVRTWDDARRIASRMAEPARSTDNGGGGGGGAHFLERARDWLEVLLYAAHLDRRPIADVADWAATAAGDDTAETVLTILISAADSGDVGAQIARTQLEGLLSTPDRERGSVLSTMTRLLRIYGSVTARTLGADPNFLPADFVRSTDTLYITASPERQNEYAPLIAGLLEEIRYAVYARHRAEEDGREPRRPHVTFVLDEANNTAPIPLPAIISEAGGQSLHVIVGIQDLSRARHRWGKEADGFLTLFFTKLVLPGVIEPYTLDALSNASGEYDRTVVGHSESTSFIGPYTIPIKQTSPSYSVQRQKVLHQGDIAQLPAGTGLLYEGADWWLVSVGLHWQHPVWRAIESESARLVPDQRRLTATSTANQP